MVVLDQHGVVQPEPVIAPTTGPNGVFLQRSQSRCGLARAQDAGSRALDRVDECCGGAGNSAQPAQEVECHTLPSEDGPRGAVDVRESLSWRDLIAILGQ